MDSLISQSRLISLTPQPVTISKRYAVNGFVTPNLIYSACNFGFDWINQNANSPETKKKLIDLVLKIADETKISFTSREFGNLTLRDDDAKPSEGDENSHIWIKVNNIVQSIPGTDYRGVQKKIREDVAENANLYSYYAPEHKVNKIKELASLDDLAFGLVNDIDQQTFTEARAESFHNDCVQIVAALIPVHKKERALPISILLSSRIQITVTEKEPQVSLTLHGHRVTLNVPFDILFEKLRGKIGDLDRCPDSTSQKGA